MTRSIRKTITDLLTAQKLGVLATLGQDYPYQNIVAFAAGEIWGRDLGTVLDFVTLARP